MYKNQLQELAQRSCFNLPSYTCIREGPDHAPRFKAVVNFNGESFESPAFCTTLRQAEHAAAEVALSALSKQGPSRSLAARVLDETGVYKNLLQETAHRAGLNLPVYTTVRSGPGHTPVFTCTVELAGLSFIGDPAKTKKQAQKNAAMAAWSALKQLPHVGSSSSLFGSDSNEQQEQVIVAHALAKLRSLDGSKPSSQNDRQRGHRKTVPVRDEINSASSAPLYSAPLPYQSWIPSNLFPDADAEMFQLWHHECSPRQQSHLPALPSPFPANDSRNSPYMQSVMQATQGQYFPVTDQDHLDSSISESASSSQFFPGYPLSFPPDGSSQVSIKEMQEENGTKGKEGWLGGGISDVDGEPISPNINRQSNPITYSPYDVSNHALSFDRSAVLKFQKILNNNQEYVWSSITDISEEERNVSNPSFFSVASDCHPLVIHEGSADKNTHEVQQREGRREKFERMRPGPSCSRPSSPNCLSFMLKNSGMFDSIQSAHNLHHPSTTTCSLGLPRGSQPLHAIAQGSTTCGVPIRQAAPQMDAFGARNPFLASPVKIRTAIPVCSARPGSLDLNSRAARSYSVAPAVHVRSVAPVCSAPSVRTPNSIQIVAQEQEDISMTTSRFNKIRI